MENEFYLILNDIRSAYNVGAIFRTADGSGVAKIYLCGYTPSPAEDTKIKKTQADKMIEKTALGAEKTVPWEKWEDIADLVDELKRKGILIAALEKTENATELKKFEKKFPLALILGNEVEGVSGGLLASCDEIISIPMRGSKESLNVSVAAGIAMYEILS